MDEPNEPIAAEPAAGAPANRDKRHDPGVIEAEPVAESSDAEETAPAEAEPVASEPPRPAPPPAAEKPPKPPRVGPRAFAGGVIGGVIVAALAAGGYSAYQWTDDRLPGALVRLGAVEKQAETNAAEDSDLDRRLKTLEASDPRAALDKVARRVATLEANTAPPPIEAIDKRLAALEAAAAQPANAAADAEAVAKLGDEAKALAGATAKAQSDIGAIDQRVAKLESAPSPQGAAATAPAPDIAPLAARLDKLDAEVAALKAEPRPVAAAPAAGPEHPAGPGLPAGPDLGAIAARLDKVEAETAALKAEPRPAPPAAAPDLQPLTARLDELDAEMAAAKGAPQPAAAGALEALAGRVDKIEAALAAPKTETRVAPEAAAPADAAPAIAIVAEAIQEKLAAGAPFVPELAALEKLGVKPEKLEGLTAVAGVGAPSGAALAAQFDALAPKILAAAGRPGKGEGVAGRFLAHLRSLVQVRSLTAQPGDDPPALVSQVATASRQGDLSTALAAFAKLPEPARAAAIGWATAAGRRAAAESDLAAIRADALGRLAGAAKP